jgi:hypothetical protein
MPRRLEDFKYKLDGLLKQEQCVEENITTLLLEMHRVFGEAGVERYMREWFGEEVKFDPADARTLN